MPLEHLGLKLLESSLGPLVAQRRGHPLEKPEQLGPKSRSVPRCRQTAWIDAQSVRIQSIESRIEDLQQVIWPLTVLLAALIFGLLYKAFQG